MATRVYRTNREKNIFAKENMQVIVTETDYLMKVGETGLKKLLQKKLPILIPCICIQELEKLCDWDKRAYMLLALLFANPKTVIFRETNENDIFEIPSSEVNRRSRCIVSLCCDLFANENYNKIHLYTSSYDVAKLAQAQGFESILNLTYRDSW